MKTKVTLFIIAIFSLNMAIAQCPYNFTFQASPANNGQVSFTATNNGLGTASFFWNFGDGTSGFGGNPTHTFNTGTWNVCLVATDTVNNVTCTVCNQVSVINNGSSTCNANFMVQDSLGYVYIMDMSTGTNLSYYWNFGDNTVSYTNGSQLHQYAQSGTYQICLIISNPNNCTDTYCTNVTVNVNGGGNGGMCLGYVNPYFQATVSGSVAYFNNTPTANAQVYFWDFGDGTTSNTIGGTQHVYASPGNYSVCLTVYQNGLFADSCNYCTNINVAQNPGCSAYFSIVQDSTNLFNYTVYSYANGGSPNSLINYLWDFGDGATSTQAYPSHTYTGSGPYNLCLTITTQGGGATCSASHCDTIIPGRMQNTTINVVNPLITGIATDASILEQMESYPNPFSNNLLINYTLSQNTTVELNLTTLLGTKVIGIEAGSRVSGKHSINIDGTNLSNGIYLLQLKTQNNTITRKVVVSK
jgi:PKD repeat protein